MSIAVFAGLAFVALSRLLAPDATERTAGQVAVLVAIVVLGYLLARSKRVGMVWSILAFAVAWFWMPIVPLVALGIVGALRKRKPPVIAGDSSTAHVGPSSATPMVDQGQDPTFEQELAAGEFKDRVKATDVAFGSIYGQHTIPLLVEVDGGECAIYTEMGAWDWPTKARFYRWLTALRTSEREDLPVMVRGRHDVPDDVSGYTEPSARNKFELAGLLSIQFTETPGFAELNVITLKRLAHEYCDVTLVDGIEGLAALDRLVVDRLCPASRFLPSTVLLIGSFFGEALIKDLGGEWTVRGRTTADVSVEIVTANGMVEANVFGKVTKLLRNGIEDSLAPMAVSIRERAAG